MGIGQLNFEGKDKVQVAGREAMKPKCPDCPHDAIGRLPEYNYDGYCMMAVETDYGSDTPVLIKCDKVVEVGKTIEAWYLEAFKVKP